MLVVLAVGGHLLFTEEERPRYFLRRYLEDISILIARDLPDNPTKDSLFGFSQRHPGVGIAYLKSGNVTFTNLHMPSPFIKSSDSASFRIQPQNSIKTELPADEVYAEIDSHFFSLLLQNLFVNAIKHGENPRVTLQTQDSQFSITVVN